MIKVVFSSLNLITSPNLPRTPANENTIQVILTDVFILLGAVSVFMIIIAGLRYILSRGNAESTAQAKNMLQYSLIGLIVAALAATIVNFVIGRAG